MRLSDASSTSVDVRKHGSESFAVSESPTLYCPTRRSTYCSGSQAARPCDPASKSCTAYQSQTGQDPVQVVPDGPQVASWTHAGLRLGSVADVPARSALRASSSSDLVVPRTRRRIDDTAFSVTAPRAWNALPTQLKLLRSTTTFRRQLKTFLFQSAYGSTDTGKQADNCFVIVMRPRSSVGAKYK